MSYPENSEKTGADNILKRMKALELRVAQLESELGITWSPKKKAGKLKAEPAESAEVSDNQSLLETQIGGSGLALMGNIVLLFGITFLMQYLQNLGFGFFSSLFGYAAVAGVFLLAHYVRKTYSNMAFLFNMNGYLLVYYVTLRLHFFSTVPLISGKIIALALLLIVTAVFIYLALKQSSQLLAGLALVLATITGIVSDTTHFMLPLATIIAAISVFFLARYGWWKLLMLSIFLVYMTYILWFLNNPFLGHPLEAISNHQFGYLYLFACAAIYSILALVPQKGTFPDNPVIASIILNGLGFSFMILFFVLRFFKDNYILMFASISLFCLIYSVILKARSSWKVTAALYALYGFVALSVTIYAIYNFPRAYLLLSVQSLLVVSMALWFRSRVIVVMNAFLYLILLIAYLASPEHKDFINFSFALVALITARTLNWKKKLLEIKTEMLRNTYLIAGFIMVLYALLRAVPQQYVTLSWTLAALLYFVLSFAMKNVKYRYLAIGTMLAAALYLFIVDLARVEIVYRVVAFLFLAIISIGVSMYYFRKMRKKTTEE